MLLVTKLTQAFISLRIGPLDPPLHSKLMKAWVNLVTSNITNYFFFVNFSNLSCTCV